MMNKRFFAVLAAVMISMMAFAKSHDLSGKVIDANGEPLHYVNVVLFSLPDTTFIQGAVTDEQGLFHIVTDKNEGILRLTSIGYETIYLPVKTTTGISIQMNEDARLLGEVVVKSSLPRTQVKGDAMRTTVDGTILEKAGTASDALSKIPFLEAERDGEVKVLGRGDAEIYINGRRVLDVKELSRLRSDQIQYVDVVQNPGARYAASTKAVVRIQLKKAQGEGVSFQDYASDIYQYGNTFHNDFSVNYRTGGLDLTASMWAGRYGHSKSLQENNIVYYVGPDRYEGRSTQDSKFVWKGWSPQLQVNYMVDENHSFGAFYKYDRHPSTNWHSKFLTDNYENDEFTEHSESNIWQDEQFRKHIFNAYYNGKFGDLSIDFNVDGLFDETKTPGNTYEQTTSQDATVSPSNRSIESETNSSNNFWASKLIVSYPVWKGNLSVGGEYSYNHRTDAYTFTATEAVPVKTTDTEINEKSAAAFAEYGRAFGRVYAQLGLRYEHLTNDYFNFGQRQDESCRDYGDFFPTAVISAPVGQVQMSLSYRRDISRPNYSNLTSSAVYINRYTYQSGNPYLKPTYTHSLVFNAAYKWTNLSVNFSRAKDSETMSTEPYPGSEDPLVSLVRPINSKEQYNQCSINAVARPVIGCWHPSWSVFTVFQNYKTPTAKGTTLTLNRPIVSLTWKNDIELPHSFRLNASMSWMSRGDYDNFRITKSRFNTSLGVQRDFNLRSLGSLTIDARCYDIFNSNESESTIFGMREITAYNPARRTFSLDLTWKFNEARSKYRGSGAGEKQKARM